MSQWQASLVGSEHEYPLVNSMNNRPFPLTL
jgi:hypothetical protein